MKTREPPPEGRDKDEENAAEPEMARFQALAKRVVAVDRAKVLAAEKKAKKKPKR